jgi:putative hemin transport protein
MNSVKTPAEIRDLRIQHPKMRERDFARIHGVSEAELVGAHVGLNVTKLNPDVATLLHGLEAVGEVMALTRNESAVHEKIGVYEKVNVGPHNAIVLGEQIDLRIFPSRWVYGFAVEKTDEDGSLRRSLQFFNGAGDAVHKVHLRPASNLEAYAELVGKLRADDQSQDVKVTPAKPVVIEGTPASAEELKDSWSKMTDTHQFFGLLKKHNLTRHQAIHLIDSDYAWPLNLDATAAMLNGAAGTDLPIMAFVGNDGCIQIHSDPIFNVSPMGPWINILDDTFHMHLRLDHITEVWAVRKPTKDGHVTSVECYGEDHELIIQFFGQRQEGTDERVIWRELVENLPRLSQLTAA